MSATQRIVRERRQYNKWAATQTMEDYALRYTADKARRWSPFRVGNTAFGAIAFLACEAIGGSLTLQFGFSNAVTAIVAVCALMFLIGLPINRYAARYGLDIDLLTRGAGFGYMGSTITSLIYASFTFILFAIEATIMSAALEMAFGIPLWLAHIFSSLVVIPMAIYGISFINRMQIATQPIWLILQLAPVVYILFWHADDLPEWRSFAGEHGDGSIDMLLFAACASTLLSLLPQIGEQADYLRFLPDRRRTGLLAWWGAMLSAGPGWVFMGGFKLALGSLLAWMAFSSGLPVEQAEQPTQMFRLVFERMVGSPGLAIALTALFVVTCQLKINVTNAYAGSIAWSNFFSRLTHAHPGRVVWLVFNVALALLLMEIGIFGAISSVLVLYANFAVGWIGALTADLVINKPLGLSPRIIEFKRAHLYDINPVGVGAMVSSIIVSTAAFAGVFGPMLQALSPFAGLLTAFVMAPAIALLTRGRYYLARPPSGLPEGQAELRCVICENTFERPDMAMCPAYGGAICSLCCSLEARCHDLCKQDSRFGQQISVALGKLLPAALAPSIRTSVGQFLGILFLFVLAIACLLGFIYLEYGAHVPDAREAIATTLWIVFLSLFLLSGVASWLLVLAHESRNAAQQESQRQTAMLMDEIEAHKRTDAELQKAKEVAENANEAKSRYVFGISHEIRSPLNAIFGYAQLLEREPSNPPKNAVRVIRRSAEHLSNLVEGLLDISKIESGRLRLNRDRVRFGEFLEQIVDMFRLQAAAKGIGFHYHRPPQLPAWIRTDEKRLRQILINLLSNAIKFTERGEASLTVRYASSQLAEFEVADTGMGIREEDLEDVFKPFERGGMPGAKMQPGSGLGLAITRVIVQIMGGEIVLRSTPGQGSRFVVKLMLGAAQDDHDSAETRRRIRGYRGPRRTVLLVDDDPVHLELNRKLLEPLGFALLYAASGEEALSLAADISPDLVLLDIAMPGIGGWETARILRERAGRSLRIMMVSANAHEYSPGGEGAPHDAFLMKPINVDVMLDTVGTLLKLDWIFQAEPADAASPSEPAGSDSPRVPLSALPYLEELLQLGRIGHVRGIEAKLREMESANPANLALAVQLRTLISDFDLKRYVFTLEQALPDAS